MKSLSTSFITMISVLLFSISMQAVGQPGDSSAREKIRKNIIKLNLSAGLLYKDSPLIEYERLTKKNQSFAVQLGLVALPFSSTRISNILQMNSALKKKGYTFTFDYRFYLTKENKYPAPHGIYIGPYLSLYHFNNENNMTIVDSTNTTQAVLLKSDFNIGNLGFQLGYQFTFGKHWTLDCIILGPSITHYAGKMSLSGDLDAINIDETYREILTTLAAKYPGIGNLLQDKIVEFHGTADTWSAGFRYSVHVGYRF